MLWGPFWGQKMVSSVLHYHFFGPVIALILQVIWFKCLAVRSQKKDTVTSTYKAGLQRKNAFVNKKTICLLTCNVNSEHGTKTEHSTLHYITLENYL